MKHKYKGFKENPVIEIENQNTKKNCNTAKEAGCVYTAKS
jgi:hypothetical protein